jgi:hypothetical protein
MMASARLSTFRELPRDHAEASASGPWQKLDGMRFILLGLPLQAGLSDQLGDGLRGHPVDFGGR